MDGYAKEIIEASTSLKVKCHLLSKEDALSVWDKLASKYLRTFNPSGAAWEYLVDPKVKQDPDAWTNLGKIIGSQPIYLLFEPDKDRNVIEIESGQSLPKILNECTGFVFYVTNHKKDFLLCFNDHDMLLSVGLDI